MSTSASELDEQRLRRKYEQCHNCHISKANSSRSVGNVTLRECAACHIAKYCSRKCQRAHWKDHKPRCEQARKRKEQLDAIAAEHEQQLEGSPTNPDDPILNPNDVLDELGSWKKRVRPLLFQAGFNALDLVGNYLAWIDNFLFISVERLPDVDESSPHWSRFRVLQVKKMHVKDFCDGIGMTPNETKDLVNQKMQIEDQNIEKGAYGTIATALKITCPKYPELDLINFLYSAYKKEDEKYVKITANWEQEFMDALDKTRMC